MSDRKYLHEDEKEKLKRVWKSWTREDRNTRSKYLWVFLTIYHTGARVSEVLRLTDESFNEQYAQITLLRLKQRNKAKGSTKTIPVSASALDEIVTARSLAKSHGNVTPAYSTFYKLFKQLAQKAGITLPKLQHPHVLRHTFAMHCLNNAVDVNSVRKLLGNTSIQSVLVYLDKTPEDIGEDMRRRGLLTV